MHIHMHMRTENRYALRVLLKHLHSKCLEKSEKTGLDVTIIPKFQKKTRRLNKFVERRQSCFISKNPSIVPMYVLICTSMFFQTFFNSISVHNLFTALGHFYDWFVASSSQVNSNNWMTTAIQSQISPKKNGCCHREEPPDLWIFHDFFLFRKTLGQEMVRGWFSPGVLGYSQLVGKSFACGTCMCLVLTQLRWSTIHVFIVNGFTHRKAWREISIIEESSWGQWVKAYETQWSSRGELLNTQLHSCYITTIAVNHLQWVLRAKQAWKLQAFVFKSGSDPAFLGGWTALSSRQSHMSNCWYSFSSAQTVTQFQNDALVNLHKCIFTHSYLIIIAELFIPQCLVVGHEYSREWGKEFLIAWIRNTPGPLFGGIIGGRWMYPSFMKTCLCRLICGSPMFKWIAPYKPPVRASWLCRAQCADKHKSWGGSPTSRGTLIIQWLLQMLEWFSVVNDEHVDGDWCKTPKPSSGARSWLCNSNFLLEFKKDMLALWSATCWYCEYLEQIWGKANPGCLQEATVILVHLTIGRCFLLIDIPYH